MGVYYTLLAIWFFFYFLLLKIPLKQRKLYSTFFFGGTLFFIMALRDKSVGIDIEHYLDIYSNQLLMSNHENEIVYTLLMDFCRFIGLSEQFFIAFTSLIIVFSFSRFFYKYSNSVFLSFFLHFTMGLFLVSMSALRQIIAVSIILFAIDFIFKRKLFWFLLIVSIASMIHSSAICFFPIYFINKINLDSFKKVFFIFFLLIPIFILRNDLISSLETLGIRYLSIYNESNHDMNVLLLIISILIPFFIYVIWKLTYKSFKEIPQSDILFFKLTIISTIITILAFNSLMIERMSYYFVSSYIILIPNTIQKLTPKTKKVIIYSLIPICVIYFILAFIDNTLEVDNYIFFMK